MLIGPWSYAHGTSCPCPLVGLIAWQWSSRRPAERVSVRARYELCTMARGLAADRRGHRAALPPRSRLGGAPGGIHDLGRSELPDGHAHARSSSSTPAQ